jgi:YD repeat-containing protein
MRESLKRHRMGFIVSIAAVALSATMPVAQSTETVVYTYDELGRLMKATYPDGKKITYVYDATGNRTQQVVSQNLAPTASEDYGEVFPDQSTQVIIDVTSNDSDPDGPFTITNFTQGMSGTVTQVNGAALRYTYTNPWFNWNTDDSFTYTITDGYGLTSVGTVYVTVYCVTSPPGGIC